MYNQELIDQCYKLSPQMVCKSKRHEIFVNNLIESTTFLNKIVPSLATRFYCVLNNIESIPSCVCGNKVMANKKDNKLGFTQYCSSECSRKHKTITLHQSQKLEDKDWLYEQRITLQKSKELIAEELGCSITPINKYLKLHNIPVRKYNESNSHVLEFLENYEWLYNKHKVERNTCEQIAILLGTSKATVSIYLSKLNIDANLCNSYPKIAKPSMECMQVIDYIKSIYSGEILIDRYGIIGELQLDIYLPELKLAIEYNGVYSHKFRPEFQKERFAQRKDERYHVEKTNRCEAIGIQLIHIFSGSWKTKQNLWKSVLKTKLGLTQNRIFARKCVIREIDVNTKNLFLEANHLQGKDKSTFKFGLYLDDDLVSVITFCKSRYNKSYDWELSRFCIKQNTSVIGGFSKLLKHFVNMNLGTIISYADRLYSIGNMYIKNGFKLLHTNKPSYYYVAKNSEILIHKSKFRKSKICNDSNRHLTEEEIMFDNGYSKVFDSGTLAFVLDFIYIPSITGI